MSWIAVAVAGAGLVGGAISADSQRKAANTAADAQKDAAQQGINAQNTQFEAVRKLLDPYVQGGNKAFGAQQDLSGLNGAAPQQSAIDALMRSPRFTSALQTGNNNILQNASATGGLRGGNTQSALGQFSPQLLAQIINEQFGQLGGISNLGQNAAAGVGNAGSANANNVSSLLAQQGAATAGGALANGRVNAGYGNLIGQVGGFIGGYGGFGKSAINPNASWQGGSTGTGDGFTTQPQGGF